ncbi:MAG TPA: HD domain-containing protein [bacterium]|nr:HD domain-containing protein [bacterium]
MEKFQKLKKIKGCFSEQALKKSRGRRKKENSLLASNALMDEINPFALDIQKIINSKSFRRLNGKTQVFASPENVLIRNRLIHTLEVKSIAETIATILGLNASLVGAIAAGHDLGHTPFGHLGERFIQKNYDESFHHQIFGLTVAEKIERKGLGLNLSFETLEGITYHSKGIGETNIITNIPMEYNVVMLADKIAYLFSDINDARRLGRLKKIPKELYFLGDNQREQVDNCITSLCLESAQEEFLSFEKSIQSQAFKFLRDWMMKNFYTTMDEEKERGILWNKLLSSVKFLKEILDIPRWQIPVVLATMTDQEVNLVASINHEATIEEIKKINKLGFYETIPYCPKTLFTKEQILW